MLTDFYDRHFFAPMVMQPIIAKERAREYPLDRLNDMRAIINYAPGFARECIGVRKDLIRLSQAPYRMSTSRLFRLNTALLLALGIIKTLELDEPNSIRDLISALSRVLIRRAKGYPRSEDMSIGMTFIPIPIDSSVEAGLALKIGWKAAELADRLGMGEHNLYAHAPVISGYDGRTIRRAFFVARAATCFPHRVLIGSHLRAKSSYVHDVPIFRARAMNAIPAQDRESVEVIVDGEPMYETRALQDVDGVISSALESVCIREELVAARTDLDVRKMLVYSMELREIAHSYRRLWAMNREAYRTILNRDITTALHLSDDKGYAQAMFDMTRLGLNYTEIG
jgi:hypothetical protein